MILCEKCPNAAHLECVNFIVINLFIHIFNNIINIRKNLNSGLVKIVWINIQIEDLLEVIRLNLDMALF